MWDLPGRRAGLGLQWLFILGVGEAEDWGGTSLRPAAVQLTCKPTIEVVLPQLSRLPRLVEITGSRICTFRSVWACPDPPIATSLPL